MSSADQSAVRELPRGRHTFTREAVAASQRHRLREGIAEAVAAKGYAATTVADVVASAAVSRRTFYEHYGDLESCFLDAYRDGMEWLLGEIRQAVRAHPHADWRERSRISVEAYLRALAARPDAAWAFSVEAMGGGRAVMEHRSDVLRRWVRQWSGLQERARREPESSVGIEDDHLLLLVGGIEELVRECLVRDGAAALPQLADRITEIAVATLERPQL
jgi:AcrR family transcriptional regulator